MRSERRLRRAWPWAALALFLVVPLAIPEGFYLDLLMFTFMLIEIITGLTLYTQVRGRWLLGWLFRWIPGVIDIQYLRLAHFCIMFTFFAFVIHHVYSAVLVSWEERNGLVESIFTGYKFIPRHELEEDSRQVK